MWYRRRRRPRGDPAIAFFLSPKPQAARGDMGRREFALVVVPGYFIGRRLNAQRDESVAVCWLRAVVAGVRVGLVLCFRLRSWDVGTAESSASESEGKAAVLCAGGLRLHLRAAGAG